MLAVLSFVAIVLLAYCILLPLAQVGIRLDQTPDGIRSPSENVEAIVAHVLFLFVAPAVSLLILARLARKAALGSGWLWLSTGVLTLVVSCDLAWTCRRDMEEFAGRPGNHNGWLADIALRSRSDVHSSVSFAAWDRCRDDSADATTYRTALNS